MKFMTKGFSLVEVMVAVTVMSVGLLAVAGFQADLISSSGENKARAEALALAQERLDELRNYTSHTIADETAFNSNTLYTTGTKTDQFPDGSGGTTNTYSGINADFSRNYVVSSGADSSKDITVNVTWSDRDGVAQKVSLSSKISWEAPGTGAYLGLEDRTALVESATGRARLGEGTLTGSETLTSNNDGTYIHDDGTEVKLSVGNQSGDTIVLTLEEACQSAGNCIGFVEIKGRVYIDKTAVSRTPWEIFVKASDAAYCHRYYLDTSTGAVTDIVQATAMTSLPSTSPNNDYGYYEYTCYLGGGWHGNIGIIFSSGVSSSGAQTGYITNADVVCVGDPTTSFDPILATRRVYRGMTFKYSTYGSQSSAPVTITTASGSTMVRYYSVGIEDSLKLPVTGSGQSGHHFMVTKITGGTADSNDCGNSAHNNKALTRPDSDTNSDGTGGDMFAGLPDDFYCLNPNYVDTFDTQTYGIGSGCPYNPADPPADRHTIEGTIELTAWSGAPTSALSIMTTAQNNCPIGPFTYNSSTGKHTADYYCHAYDWGNGWTGSIIISSSSSLVSCPTDTITHTTGITGLTQNQDFTTCVGGSPIMIYGNVTLDNTQKKLDSATIDGQACDVNASGTYYECKTYFEPGTSWSGSLRYQSSGTICHPDATVEGGDITVSYSAMPSASHPNHFPIYNNANSCAIQ